MGTLMRVWIVAATILVSALPAAQANPNTEI